MTTRVSPTDRIRSEIDALFAGDRDLGEVVEDIARLGVRLILQTALEAEVTQFLGRERYDRGERVRAGSRNGHSDVSVKTTAGPVTLERPKLRGTDEAFASRLLGKHVTRTNALESLSIAGYVRGLSTRDAEGVAGRRPRRAGGAVEVDGLASVSGHHRRVRRLRPSSRRVG